MGCLKEERNALLKIKATFNHPNGSSLPSWGDGDGDCCSWEGIECDNTTSRVTQLVLSYIRDLELREYGPWVIDASLFVPLEELQVLDLRNNCLSDLNGTLHLKKLNRLDLSFNNLERVPSLYKKTSTEAQQLSSNQPKGVNLEVLDLGKNNLANDALTDIMRITSLKALYINQCGLNASSKFLEGLCGLRYLEELDINSNGLWGPLPSCLCNMTSLCVLDVANNNFSGAIPSSLLYNLKSLEYIVFFGNAFEGSLLLASLANNSNLEVFHLLNNHNHLEVNTEEPTWFPSFQLKVFTLSNCVLNKDANVVIPSFLKEQHDLILLQLIHNGMNGNFPNWLLENNVYLERFELTGNNLSGTFHLPSNLNLDNMLKLDVSANIIEGEIPSWIGSILPNLIYLNLSKNLLEGRIPYSMGNMNQLHTLDLSNNRFTGEIPEPLAKNCTSLVVLKLSSNNLQGNMLPRGSNLTSLRYLYLDNNCFIGDISSGILNSSLQVLDVSNNSLSGTLPNWIGDIQFLEMLMLSSNSFKGPLPLSFCNLHYLKLLDLSSNNLGPNIPPCVNVTVMRFLHLTNDMLAGHLPEFLSRASLMVTLDLRHNALSGSIPETFSDLKSVESLDLSYNNLIGQIPPQLTELYTLSNFRVAYKNLSSRTPDRKNQFGTLVRQVMKDDPRREAFLWSFAGSYVVAFLGMVLFLYLNSYYEYVLFELVCKLIPSFPH
ncbi:receptor-like protein 15 [Eucalyptus grandis]|uniref:receptor-like protein 15 n=1 Tax=Eucalyptus grandis TaxID=71139 RepID=UPI00192EEC60|nr:receptor-like protein 15 [Eucalyptus grandis]